jgi:hypothetical protein
MIISESVLRKIIQEELSLLSEVIKNKHGYNVRSPEDVKWTPDKRRIPVDRNPFIGSSPAFNSWYNDGQMVRPWMRSVETKTGDVKTSFGRNDVYFGLHDHVIIPTLNHVNGGMYTDPGVIMSIHHKDPAALGVPGATPGQLIPLVDIRWPATSKSPSEWLRDVGFAFLVHLGPPGMKDPEGGALYAMKRHRDGVDAQREKESRAAEREERRAAREAERAPPPPPPPEAPRTPPPSAIRRVGGVAAPPPPRKPARMSDDEFMRLVGPRRK